MHFGLNQIMYHLRIVIEWIKNTVELKTNMYKHNKQANMLRHMIQPTLTKHLFLYFYYQTVKLELSRIPHQLSRMIVSLQFCLDKFSLRIPTVVSIFSRITIAIRRTSEELDWVQNIASRSHTPSLTTLALTPLSLGTHTARQRPSFLFKYLPKVR